MDAVYDGYNFVNLFLSQGKVPGLIHSNQLLDMQMVDAVLVGE